METRPPTRGGGYGLWVLVTVGRLTLKTLASDLMVGGAPTRLREVSLRSGFPADASPSPPWGVLCWRGTLLSRLL